MRYLMGVGIFYLAALIFGLGTMMVQLFMGGDADADADVDASAGLDHDMGDADLDHDLDASAEGHSDVGFLPIFLSLRFWVFGSLAFGMVGSLLHFLMLAGPVLTAVVATVLGLGSGTVASWVFRALSRQSVTSGAGEDDAVGHVGKVLIGVSNTSRGKIRIQLKGQTIDLIATTDESELPAGEQVLIEEMRDGQAHVSRAPADFLPRR